MDQKVAKVYGNRVRVRACGICWRGDELLMVNHAGITATDFWAPPGGGVEFGQSIENSLKQEFLEETGFVVSPGDFMFGCELIKEPLHSIELFYHVQLKSGELTRGHDPEIQIIKDVRFITVHELKAMPDNLVHGLFKHVEHPDDLRNLKGFFRI